MGPDQGNGMMLTEGDKAPALMARLSGGTELDLSRPGQLLALYFYPRDYNG